MPSVSDLSERLPVFLIGALVCAVGSWAVPITSAERIFLGAGTGFFALGAIGAAYLFRARLAVSQNAALAARAMGEERCPALVVNTAASVIFANENCSRLRKARVGSPLADVLQSNFAVGSQFLDRVTAQVELAGSSAEVIHVRGRKLELRARKLTPDMTLWSFDERANRADYVDAADKLAIIYCDPTGRIIGGNRLADEHFGRLPDTLSAAEGEVNGYDLVEVRNSDGWREHILVPAPPDPSPAMSETILAEPGLLEALPVPMLKIAADGRLLEANGEARQMLSLDSQNLPALFELVEGMGRPIADWLGDAINGRGLLKPEIVRAVRPGAELFLQITLGRTKDTEEAALVGILNDATELKSLEAQFGQSQKMQAIGQLAGGVAHDFNNLLTAISGHCDLLLLRHDSRDPDYADLIQISQNANRAASLVGQLLAFSRKQNLKPQALDLRDAMSELAHLLNRLIGERVRLNVVHAPGDQMIRADRRQLEQVIVNLVVNARDAMPEGGEIDINIRKRNLKETLVRDRAHVPPGDYVLIEVSDTGTGISKDALSKIFEPFFTTKKQGEGTGLGLSTAYGIVKQSGGYIFADSRQGQGTTFSLYFPSYIASKEPEPLPEISVPLPLPVQGGGVVLLVEDEAPVRAFASRALRMRGYTVLEAECAEDALETLADPELHVDVFVTDVVMPGLDGPSWVRRALEDRPGTRTVFVSGYSEEGRAENRARIPNSVFLPKPFSLHQLTSVVNEQFH